MTHDDPIRRRRVAAVAVAVVLLTVGAWLFISALRGEVPAADSTVPVPNGTEITMAPNADGPLGWAQVTPPQGLEQVEEMWAMTVSGYALWTGSEIWTSADGMEWELSATTPGLVDVYIWPEARSVIDFGGEWLVVGEDPAGHMAVAYSNDGSAWGMTPLPETSGDPLMIAASRSTAVVIGKSPSSSPADMAVWISHDGRSWFRAAEIPESDQGVLHPERLVFTGTEFVMQARIGMFPQMWRSPDGEVWIEGDRYAHGMSWDGRAGVEALTSFDGQPLVLQRSSFAPGYLDIENTNFTGWPTSDVTGEPVGGDMGVILASPTELWFTSDGDVWTSQGIGEVFGAAGDMIGAAVSDTSVLVAFSPKSGEPIELWLGEPTK